jgi:hypothetical protein
LEPLNLYSGFNLKQKFAESTIMEEKVQILISKSLYDKAERFNVDIEEAIRLFLKEMKRKFS